MTFYQIFVLGLAAGFAIGAPYGPSGTLSLYRSIQYGWRIGSLTALGSLLAIFLFSFLTAMFIELAAPIIDDPHIVRNIRLIMGIALLIMGMFFIYGNWRSSTPQDSEEVKDRKEGLTSFLSAFVVGLVSGKNVIGFPTFLIATQYPFDQSNPALLKAIIFSGGSLLSSSFLYLLLISTGVKWGPLLFARILPLMKYMIACLFIGLGLYLIVGFFL